MDPRMYPDGKQAIASRDVLTDPATILDYLVQATLAGGNTRKAVSLNDLMAGVGVLRTKRVRATIAQVNAGHELIAAIDGYKIRLVDAYAVAVGGAVAAVTTVDILGTQSTSKKLVAFGQAQLTQGAVVRAGATGGTVLADGASFAACDENTAITADITGDDITTATHVDFVLTYTIERG